MKKWVYLLFLIIGFLFGIIVGFNYYHSFKSIKAPVKEEKLVLISQLEEKLSNQRVNAIVLAAKKVSPAVVSIAVTQTRIVTYSPFSSPFFDDFWRDFFKDFFPQRRYKEEIKGLGSGVIIDPTGYIVTNSHVVENATEIKVSLPDGRSFDGEIIALDPEEDLALLKINGKDLPYAQLGNSDDLLIGEWVIALGNPFGFLIEDTKPTVTVGVISAVNREVRGRTEGRVYKNMIQTDAAINPGNSGGPLVNILGEVIGINTFILSHAGGSEGVGFAIPINRVKEFIEEAKKEIKAKKEVEKIKIEKWGIEVSDIDNYLKKRYSLQTNYGAVILKIEENSLGEALGLDVGDAILSFQDEKVVGALDLKKKIENFKGNTFKLIIERKGERIRILYRF
uniref:Trypsin-like serine protease n=1 Tax=candidate division WOR-3 bacterium TaxID=2052148 RepID=A0A7V5XYX5_UNCW3